MLRSTLNRRRVLQTASVALSLPWLESMASAREADSNKLPKRAVYICTTLGLYPQAFWPETIGSSYEETEYLKVLAQHRDHFTLFSGLQHDGQTGRQPHNCEMTWLTAAQGPGLDGFRNTISVDQVAARHFAQQTRFASLALGSNSPQSQSYTAGGVMIPSQTSPSQLFSDLFMRGNAAEIARQ